MSFTLLRGSGHKSHLMLGIYFPTLLLSFFFYCAKLSDVFGLSYASSDVTRVSIGWGIRLRLFKYPKNLRVWILKEVSSSELSLNLTQHTWISERTVSG